MKTVFLVCNAHLDPVWQWEWEEGAAEVLSTFRTAARFCRECDGFVFNHNEALLYRWVEEYEPELFEEICELVKLGKWHIMGGWHLQPDCNMPSGEAMVRQIVAGRRYFKQKFDVTPRVAINFDPFGHSRGLVQIMRQCGYEGYLFMRPSPTVLPLPAENFMWQGYAGSSIMARRTSAYNSLKGQAAWKVRRDADNCPDGDITVALWGVGNHGGGVSAVDLADIEKMRAEDKDVRWVHATPEAYFEALKAQKKELPVFDRELTYFSVGCYTSMIRVKQKYRATENAFFTAERMAAAAHANGLMEYPQKELDDALYDLLTVQFHDILPGSSVQPAEEMALRMMDHAGEILSRIKTRAFMACAVGQKKADEDAIPLMLFNPHPYAIEGDFSCEMMLWGQNWADEFSYPAVYQDGRLLPTQCEKENSSFSLDWRKRAVFHAVLQPMQMNRFDCRYEKVPSRPKPEAEQDGTAFILRNPTVTARINKQTGLLESYCVDGSELLTKACDFLVLQDNGDPWGMRVDRFDEVVGTFTPLKPEEVQALCGIKADLAAVHVIESGKVRTTVEALLGFGRSRLIVQYTLSHFSREINVSVRVQWGETQKMLKWAIPAAEGETCFGDTVYGREELPCTGRENAAQKFVQLQGASKALALVNNGCYGFSVVDGALRQTLLRSPAYCAHPILERELLMQDRYTPHMEQGERLFSFALVGGTPDEVERMAPELAMRMAEPPMALSLYPSSRKGEVKPLVTLQGEVKLTACKLADDGNGYILRLFNPLREAQTVCLQTLFGIGYEGTLQGYELRTLRLTEQSVTETDPTEA